MLADPTSMPEKKRDWRQEVAQIQADAVDDWFNRAQILGMAGITPQFFLYFRRSTENNNGALVLAATDMPSQTSPADDGWELATPQALPRGATKNQGYNWVRENSGNLPILSWGK